MLMKVLLATDGSDQSMKAVQWTVDNLGDKAKVTLFAVAPFAQDLLAEMPPNIQQKLENEAKSSLDKAKAAFDAKNVAVETALAVGMVPANNIIDKAQDGGFDMIVMGSTGIGGLKRAMMGSTASKVVSQTPCSVTIIR
ncbi:MAG TPA: universal stress protein [Desulfonatronum sp.]|nr:universal stress protein [Desulfonatronum sp.]